MPCMGPSKPTPQEIDNVTKNVLYLLQQDFNVFVGENDSPFPGIRSGRDNAIKQLKDAIAEILWQDRCEVF